MKRRDFVLLRPGRENDVVELSCERLYMRWLDTRMIASDPDENFDPVEDGEPPAAFEGRSTEELLEDLDRALRGVHVLRVVDTRWLDWGGDELKLRFEKLLASFRARGGRVDFSRV